jgi:hypothetical protein
MASRFARHWFLPALFAVCAALPVVGAGTASAAATAPTDWGPGDHHGYGHDGYRHYRHHYHPNCNNDPDSPYAMGPDCPRSHNTHDYPPWWD